MRTALLIVAWLVGLLVVCAAILLFAIWLHGFERATLYKCTACFAENPDKCATHTDTTDDWCGSEQSARDWAVTELCMSDDADYRRTCEDSPPERFNIVCSSWRQWARTPVSNPFVVH